MDLYKLRRERARSVNTLILDGDGVIFPNVAIQGLRIAGEYLKPKNRTHDDGQGITFARGIGFRVLIVTNANGVHLEAAEELVGGWNDLPSARAGRFSPVDLISGRDGMGKLGALQEWLAEHGGTLEECIVMGNDIGDYYMLEAAGLSAAPADAERRIREMCLFVAQRPGGYGAIRDLANFILEVRGIDPITLPLS
jgi:3-deoxy-D-manno-octulosonate 8-phosphate phosphatase (KDO 8-P phosphatase)